MDKLFNFEDETLNKGFQIDMSLLSPEQREHVLKIFEARGYFHKNYKTLKDSWDSIIKYPLVCFNPNGNDCSLAYYGNGTSKENIRKNLANNALIDYPTLCRAAVQLEPREYAIGNTLEIRELFEYAKYIGLCQFVKYVGGENAIYCTPHRTIYTTINLNKGSLTINEFEAKLRGVSPVVKQSLTTEKPNQNMNAANTFVGGVKPSNNKPTTEKPKYYKHLGGGYIVEYLDKGLSWDTFTGVVVFSKHDCPISIGSECDTWVTNQFEPCDYPEPVEVGHPIKGVNTDINGDPTTAKGLVDWCKAYSMRKEKAVEVSPETEQQKETIADCGKKTLMDNPSLADNIGSHMNLAFDYAKKLVSENTRLRAQLYRLPMLEQENAELKAQLAVKNEQPNKEPVYDYDWLLSILIKYNHYYGCLFQIVDNGLFSPLFPQDSALIILRAVAKELNGGEIGSEVIFYDTAMGRYDVWVKETPASYGNILFVDAQKAINILTTHFPVVLKNYFAWTH